MATTPPKGRRPAVKPDASLPHVLEIERDVLRKLNAEVIAERDAAVAELAESQAGASFVSRLAAAMNAAGAVFKSSTNEQQGYKFASAEAILGAVRAPLFERGIVLIPSQPMFRHEVVQTRNGKPSNRVTASFDFTFMDGQSDATLTVAGWQGIGEDSGDKAIGKAGTSAIKTFIRTTWLLPTEHDDPEKEPKTLQLPAWAEPVTPMVAANEIDNALHAMLGSEIADMVGRKIAKQYGGTPALALDVAHIIGKAYAHAQAAQTDETPPANDGPTDAVTAARDAALWAGEPVGNPMVKGQEIEPTGEQPGTVPNPLQVIVESGSELPPVPKQVEHLRLAGCICPDVFPSTDSPADVLCPIDGHGTPIADQE